MTRQVTVTAILCGVDVSSTHLDAELRADSPVRARFANTQDGIAALAAFCREHAVGLVVMEATGGYERLPFVTLWAADIPASLVNPRAVRRFAEGMGCLEKTDRLDAGLIAWYAETKRIQPQHPAPENQARLTAWVCRLRQLTEARVVALNQRRLVTDPVVRDSADQLLAALAGQIRAFETRIADLIGADPLWAALDAAFRSIKGVASRTTARLMAELPEIGTLSSKAIAKLAGLAPIARDSGKANGRRAIRGGREGVRSILFVVAEIVRRHHPDFRDFHQRLRDAGKPPKVVRIALAHKLLTRLNAKARDVRSAIQPQAA
jgi:transposase